jgi:hypothetical protein
VSIADRDPLTEKVFCDGAYKPFGEVTAADARRCAEELGEAGSWGPLARVAGVALAWRELADELRQSGSGCVAELDPAIALTFAKRVWAMPPRGSLL